MNSFTPHHFGRAFALLALPAFCLSFSLPSPFFDNLALNDPWKLAYKQDGIIIHYDIQDCLKERVVLCLKVSNNTGGQKKLRFSTEVSYPDGSSETFNYIKSVAAYATEKSDCSVEARATGLVRPLKSAMEGTVVKVNFQREATVAASNE
jgi:hypothetical protein